VVTDNRFCKDESIFQLNSPLETFGWLILQNRGAIGQLVNDIPLNLCKSDSCRSKKIPESLSHSAF